MAHRDRARLILAWECIYDARQQIINEQNRGLHLDSVQKQNVTSMQQQQWEVCGGLAHSQPIESSIIHNYQRTRWNYIALWFISEHFKTDDSSASTLFWDLSLECSCLWWGVTSVWFKVGCIFCGKKISVRKIDHRNANNKDRTFAYFTLNTVMISPIWQKGTIS